MKLRIGYLSTFYHTSILMIARGTLNSEIGIEVDWNLYGTGPAIVDAFEKKEIDIAYIGLPPAIIGICRGVNIVCVAGGHIEGTVLSGKNQFRPFPEIGKLDEILKQFSGLKIGVPGTGSIHDVIISESLKNFALDKEIEVLNFRWADEVLEAICKDKISAAVGTPALAVAVKHYAGGKVLYPPADLWPNNPSYGIVVEKSFLRKENALVERFLVLHEETESFLRNNTDNASHIIADTVGVIYKKFVRETLELSPKYCAHITEEYISTTMSFVTALTRLGYINRSITPEEIFDTSLINKIHTEKDHYGSGISVA